MLNDRGRKVIKEKMGNNQYNAFDHYKNMNTNDAPNFDQDWNRVAEQLNFRPSYGNALEYGSSDPFADNRGHNDYANRRSNQYGI